MMTRWTKLAAFACALTLAAPAVQAQPAGSTSSTSPTTSLGTEAVAPAPGMTSPAGAAAAADPTAAGSPSDTLNDSAATTGSAGGGGSLSEDEQKFVEKAARGGLAEVALGTLATTKAQSDDVKQLGQRMVTDHSASNQELSALASAKGVTLPTEPGPKHKEEQQRLEGLSGEAFDKAYIRAMHRDHARTIADFQKMSGNARDAELKGWIDKTLPVLQEHATLVDQTAQKAGVKVGEGGGKKKGKGGKKNAGESGGTHH